MTPAVALTIAGTDSGGAAGIAADLATFAALGVHGSCVITAVTAQDTLGVRAIHPVPLDVVEAQLAAVVEDLPVAMVKTGLLGTPEVVESVAACGLPLVVDPVLVATSGAVLGDAAVVEAYRRHLLPVATITTPNLDEARALTGHDGPPAQVAERLADFGCAVVVTGGPDGPADLCTDWLALPGGPARPLTHPAVATTNDHGTGCTFSAALAAELAQTRAQTRGHIWPAGPPVTPEHLPAEALVSACLRGAAFTTHQLDLSQTWTLGRGRGPIAHSQEEQPCQSTPPTPASPPARSACHTPRSR